MKKYHTLLSRDAGDTRWAIEFGDYVKSVVTQEMRDMKYCDYKKREYRIITTGDTQHDINAAVAALNGSTP